MTKRTYTGKTEADLIESLVQESLLHYEERLRYVTEQAMSWCDSPIERVFAAALVQHNQDQPPGEFCHIYPRGNEWRSHFPGTHVFPQAQVGNYRVDFLIIHEEQDGTIHHTVVELDGHDFHERTKQQASHDKARDRYFTRKGWKVVRFTGSDVWNDANECVGEALIIAENLGKHIP